ncbi:MAG TPA: hypothetical protein VM537_06795 [Anaerolineae bacterium]|nr:hypothetical protein [Anaerolineae bacterium]
MSCWIDERGNRITLSVGIACSRSQGCRARFFLTARDPETGKVVSCLSEPAIDQCREKGEAEKIVEEYARDHGWESHVEPTLGLYMR